MDPARLFAAEGRDRVLNVLLGHDLVRGSEIVSREDLIEETADQHPSDFFHRGSFLAWTRAASVIDCGGRVARCQRSLATPQRARFCFSPGRDQVEREARSIAMRETERCCRR